MKPAINVTRPLAVLSFTAALLAAGPALAHIIVGGAGGLATGVLHPLTGVDHLLAMVAVGILGGLIGGRSLYVLPGLFVAGLCVGAGAGLLLPGLPFIELAIAGSLVALGLALVRPDRLPLRLMMVAILGFGMAHGYAHGAEAPISGQAGFFAGMVAMTLVLHLAGAVAMRFAVARPLARVAGLGTATVGVALLVTG